MFSLVVRAFTFELLHFAVLCRFVFVSSGRIICVGCSILSWVLQVIKLLGGVVMFCLFQVLTKTQTF